MSDSKSRLLARIANDRVELDNLEIPEKVNASPTSTVAGPSDDTNVNSQDSDSPHSEEEDSQEEDSQVDLDYKPDSDSEGEQEQPCASEDRVSAAKAFNAGGGLKGLATAFAGVFGTKTSKKSESEADKANNDSTAAHPLAKVDRELAEKRRRENEKLRLDRELSDARSLQKRGVHETLLDLKTVKRRRVEMSTAAAASLNKEKELQKLACRGVVRLFNEMHKQQKAQGVAPSRKIRKKEKEAGKGRRIEYVKKKRSNTGEETAGEEATAAGSEEKD